MAKRTTKNSGNKSKKATENKATDDAVEMDASADTAAETSSDVTPDPVEDAEIVAETTPEPTPAAAPEKAAEPAPVTPTETPPAPVYAETNRENSVLLPMILGGLIAGGLGYGAAYLTRPVIDVPLDQQVAAHATDIAALQEAVGADTPEVDLTPLTEQIDTLATDTATQMADLVTRIAAFDERLSTVEKQPSADGTLQETAIGAFQAELDELRAQTEQMAADAAAALQATRDEAAAIEQNAVDNARRQTARAALARVQGALESGAPYGDLLPDLADAMDDPLPEALTDSADGVPTLGQLQADFPAAARAALSAARTEGASGEDSGGFGSFLRNQLNVRSTAPQEGDGADAVLSRAEAALREGRLNETLSETAALPEVVRGALSEWLERAEQRVATLDAAATISQSLNDN